MTVFSANSAKWFSTTITETQVHICRKCHSKEIVKNGTNGHGNLQYHCGTCGAHSVLDPDGDIRRKREIIIIMLIQDSQACAGP